MSQVKSEGGPPKVDYPTLREVDSRYEDEQFWNDFERTSPENWKSCGCPIDARTLAEIEIADGVPTGIGKYKGTWYIVQSSGQGSYVIWEETK